jgi:Ca2+-binding RTX toxin-like protein
MFRRLRPFVIVGLAVIAYLAVTATPGSGHPATNGVEPHWSCKASAGYVNGFGGPSPLHLEALVANGDATTGVDGAQCQKDGSGFPQPTPLSFGSPQSGQVVEDAPYAYTTINNDFTYKQKAEGHTGVDHVLLQGNGHSLEATVVRADATAACTNGVPTPTTTSKVAGVSVDGTPTPVNDSGAQQVISNQPGFTAVVNEKTVQSTDGGKTYVQRAIHVQLGDTSQGVEIVIAEAKVGYHGDATQLCTPPPARCPAGATYDQSRGVCIVTVTTQAECPAGSARDAASGACIAVVGPPSAAPGAGGNVVPLGDVRGIRSTSPCKNKRFGRQVGIVGTNRGDRITGSNRSDRIFVFGGNDRVSGGRGNDCIEGGLGSDQLDGSNGSDWLLGGAGNDQLSGGQRNDVIYGGAGNDKLIGGTGNDKLYSGKGRNKLDGGKGNDLLVGGPDRDYITGGNGRDVIRAGRGNDDINVATAGPPAKVDCGPGVDTVRINNNELRTLKHCERVLVTTRLTRLKSYNKSYQNHKK